MRKLVRSLLVVAVSFVGADWAHASGSVFSFGARCDGVTDDTGAIQTALNSGGLVYIPDGFTCVARNLMVNVDGTTLDLGTSTITVGTLTPPQTRVLRTRLGLRGFTLLGRGPLGGQIVGVRPPGGVVGFHIGLSVDGACPEISETACSVVVRGVTFRDWPTDGMDIGGVGGTVTNGQSTHVFVEGVVVTNVGRNGVAVKSSEYVRIDRLTCSMIDGDPAACVDVETNPGDIVKNVRIRDSFCTDVRVCFYIHNGSGVLMEDIALEDSWAQNASRFGVIVNGVRGVRVAGNTVIVPAWAGTGNPLPAGISVGSTTRGYAQRVTVQGNRVEGGTGARGVIFAGAEGGVYVLDNVMIGGKPEVVANGIRGLSLFAGNVAPGAP